MSKNYGYYSLAFLSYNPPSRRAKQFRENCLARYKICVMLQSSLMGIGTVSSTSIYKVFSLSRTFVTLGALCTCLEQGHTHLNFPHLPMSILHNSCKCWAKPHAYHSQGILGNAPPKGDSCILHEDVKTAADGVGVRRAFSAKTFPKAAAEAGRCCTASSTASITPHSADSGLGLFSSSLSPGWCNHTVLSNYFNHLPFTWEMHAT